MVISEDIFKDLQFALDFTVFTSFKAKQNLRKKITSNGGIISYIITKQSNFLIRENDADLEFSHKCRLAKRYQIPIVSEQFVDACLELKALVDYHPYLLTTAQSTINSFGKGKIKVCDSDIKELTKPSRYCRRPKVPIYPYKDSKGPRFYEADYKIVKAVLLQGDEKRSGIPFCCIEIHESLEEDIKEDAYKFCIFTHSGHIKSPSEKNFGSKECRYVKIPEEAIGIYSRLYNLHTNPPHSLKLCQKLIHQAIGSDKFQETHDSWVLVPIHLDKRVASLMSHIWSEAVQELDEILGVSIDDVTKVEEAEGILLEIEKAQGLNNIDEIGKLSEEFYQLIPHKNKATISTRRLLVAKHNLCQLIKDFLCVTEASHSSYDNKATTLYRNLNCHIEVLETDNEEYKIINDMLKFKIRNIFKIRRGIEEANFDEKLDNKKLLFHASSVENFVGILSRGLLLPRIIVQDGIERTDIGMLGSGIYFSNCAWVSARYAVASKSTGIRLMLVNEVALGKCCTVDKYNTQLNTPPEDYNSMHGISQEYKKTSQFEGDEFVIYSTTQQRLQYLIEFSTNDEVVRENIKSTFVCNEIEDNLQDSIFIKDRTEKCDTDIEHLLSKKEPLASITSGLQSSNNKSLPLKAVHIRARLVDLASQVIVFQEYVNFGTQPIEAKYVFPLDDMAAVCGFEAWVNGICYVGKIREKKLAHQQYRQAIKEGHGAYLMDEETPEVFTVSVGNLPCNSRILIKITYVAELSLEGELISFIIPSSVAPWEQKKALNTITQEDVEKIKVNETSNTSIQVHVDMPFDIKNISSPTHKILLKKTATKATVKMAPQESLDHDFQLYVKLSEIHVPRMWVENNKEYNSQACMLAFYPEFEAETEEVSNTIIALDCSNSMKGEAFLNAQQLAFLILTNLPSNCKFNVVLFGSIFVELFPECQSKSFQTVYDAEEFIQSSAPNLGNSEIIMMLQSYQSLPLKEPLIQNIILITDGYLNNPNLLLKRVRQYNDQLRIFTMGIGSRINKHFLRSISAAGAGSFEYFDSKLKYKWNEKVKSTIFKTQQVALKNISIEWQQFNDYDAKPVQAPKFILSLFSGSRLVVYGFVANCSMAHLKAYIGQQELSTSVFTSELSKTEGKVLHALTARAIIRDWENGILHENQMQHEAFRKSQQNYIIDLSKQYGILTTLTSFIAIEKRNKDIPVGFNEGPTINDLINNSEINDLSYIQEEEIPVEDDDYIMDFSLDDFVEPPGLGVPIVPAYSGGKCLDRQSENAWSNLEGRPMSYSKDFSFSPFPTTTSNSRFQQSFSPLTSRDLRFEQSCFLKRSFILERDPKVQNLCDDSVLVEAEAFRSSDTPRISSAKPFSFGHSGQISTPGGFSGSRLFGAMASCPPAQYCPTATLEEDLMDFSEIQKESSELDLLYCSEESSVNRCMLKKKKKRMACPAYFTSSIEKCAVETGSYAKKSTEPSVTTNLAKGLPFCSCLLKSLSPYLPQTVADIIEKGNKLQESDLQHLSTELQERENLDDLNEKLQNIIKAQTSFGCWNESFIKSLSTESDWENIVQRLTDAGLNSLGKRCALHIINCVCTILVILQIYHLLMEEAKHLDLSSSSAIEDHVYYLLNNIHMYRSSDTIFTVIARALLYVHWVNERYPLVYQTLQLGKCWELGVYEIAAPFFDSKLFDL